MPGKKKRKEKVMATKRVLGYNVAMWEEAVYGKKSAEKAGLQKAGF